MLVSDGPKGPTPVGERVNIVLVLEYCCHIKLLVYKLITEIFYRFFPFIFVLREQYLVLPDNEPYNLTGF
jgi:hypothetical protein